MTPRGLEPLSPHLARWASQLRYDDLPQEVVHTVKRSLLDYLGVTIAGADTEIARKVLACLTAIEGEGGDASAIGTGRRLSPLNATLANGVAATVLELDGGHARAPLHVMTACVPAIFSAAQARKSSGKDLVVAIAVACEVLSRLAVAASGAAQKGFNCSSLLGVLGAAIGVAKLLGSDTDTIVHALGLAGSNTGGMFDFGDGWLDSWSVNVGRTGREGYLCAVLAAQGIAGPADILDGSMGIAAMFNGRPFDRGIVLNALGQEWRMLEMYVKLYPCCRILHSTIDAAVLLRTKIGAEIDRIEKITIETSAASAKLDGKRIDSMMAAQFSLPYGVAAGLVFGPPKLEHFADAARGDPRLLRLVERVDVVESADPDISGRRMAARVGILLDGATVDATVLEPSGNPENPTSDAELEDKFRYLADPRIGSEAAQRIRDAVWGLCHENNGLKLFGLLSDAA